MELKELRCRIDEIDDQLVKLFVQRMEVSAQVAAYKKEHSVFNYRYSWYDFILCNSYCYH